MRKCNLFSARKTWRALSWVAGIGVAVLSGCNSNTSKTGGGIPEPGPAPISGAPSTPAAARGAELQVAAQAGDARRVHSLLEQGADLNVKDELGRTPLHFAAVQDRADTVQELLKKGANANLQDNHGETPLMVASRQGMLECVKALLDGGADPNIKDNQNPPGWTALTIATQQSKYGVMQALLKKGADPNYLHHLQMTPLMEAAMKNDPEAIRILLAAKADPDRKDFQGITALARAVEGRHREAVEALLAGKANPNVRALSGQPLLKKARLLQQSAEATRKAVSRPGSAYTADTRAKVAAQVQDTTQIVALLKNSGAKE